MSVKNNGDICFKDNSICGDNLNCIFQPQILCKIQESNHKITKCEDIIKNDDDDSIPLCDNNELQYSDIYISTSQGTNNCHDLCIESRSALIYGKYSDSYSNNEIKKESVSNGDERECYCKFIDRQYKWIQLNDGFTKIITSNDIINDIQYRQYDIIIINNDDIERDCNDICQRIDKMECIDAYKGINGNSVGYPNDIQTESITCAQNIIDPEVLCVCVWKETDIIDSFGDDGCNSDGTNDDLHECSNEINTITNNIITPGLNRNTWFPNPRLSTVKLNDASINVYGFYKYNGIFSNKYYNTGNTNTLQGIHVKLTIYLQKLNDNSDNEVTLYLHGIEQMIINENNCDINKEYIQSDSTIILCEIDIHGIIYFQDPSTTYDVNYLAIQILFNVGNRLIGFSDLNIEYIKNNYECYYYRYIKLKAQGLLTNIDELINSDKDSIGEHWLYNGRQTKNNEIYWGCINNELNNNNDKLKCDTNLECHSGYNCNNLILSGEDRRSCIDCTSLSKNDCITERISCSWNDDTSQCYQCQTNGDCVSQKYIESEFFVTYQNGDPICSKHNNECVLCSAFTSTNECELHGCIFDTSNIICVNDIGSITSNGNNNNSINWLLMGTIIGVSVFIICICVIAWIIWRYKLTEFDDTGSESFMSDMENGSNNYSISSNNSQLRRRSHSNKSY